MKFFLEIAQQMKIELYNMLTVRIDEYEEKFEIFHEILIHRQRQKNLKSGQKNISSITIDRAESLMRNLRHLSAHYGLNWNNRL